MKHGVIGFIIGLLLAGVVLGIQVRNLKAEVNALHVQAQQEKEFMNQQAALKVKDEGNLQAEQSHFQQVSQQLDSCQSKFNRGTILYEQAVIGGASRQWVLPVDIEPVYVGQKQGVFSHYDPKTQMETVKFAAKTQ